MLDRRARARASGTGQAALGFAGDGFAELVPAGELRELTPAERVAAELEILGIDLSQHVLSFYTDLLAPARRDPLRRRCTTARRATGSWSPG